MSDFDLPKTSLDFAGMGALRGQAQRREEKATRETATQFEAMFIQMMLKSMREASNVMKSDMFKSHALETFEGMYDKELSMSMAKRNALGFADLMVKQLSQTQSPASTAEMLASKQQGMPLIPAGMPLNKPVMPMVLKPAEQTPMPLPTQTLKPLRLNPSMPLPPTGVNHE